MASEKQKMLSQKPYIASDPELSKERMLAQKTCFEINSLSPEFVEKRNQLLNNLLGSVKDNFYVEPPFHCDYGYNISIGEKFYSNYNLIILDCA